MIRYTLTNLLYVLLGAELLGCFAILEATSCLHVEQYHGTECLAKELQKTSILDPEDR